MLEAHQAGFSVHGRRLLTGVDFRLVPGECVALMGPNGAGKSTLLKLLSGELHPQPGEVVLNGRPMRTWTMRARARVRAVLPQHLDLAFPFTAFEVALLGRTPHHSGAPGRTDRERVRELLALLDVAHLAERPYTRLSGGERARVQLARVFAQIWDDCGPGGRYLLLDEPTAPLDIAHQLALMERLAEVAGRGIGVLMIVHDLNLAAAHCDRIALLRDGRLLHDGAPREVLTAERLRETFDVDAVIMPHPRHDRPWIAFHAHGPTAASTD
ncbi:heme ABC transporter ATP-binding protein [Pseudothauera nasutitermitis]|uniref:Heme ABC transporter ATP-binding protein n=1 Tax=Pseudothauera nasutitermitis TaxID=2565930 RepID=A0A4S4ALW1_9RHOO|nr:heme ABC transporter ATP-binding protein [Pseudothauera nasutitermitis]THF60568.1 heme ABC transporter ATP-binding protein [Pseudothauera nasutitermitis]